MRVPAMRGAGCEHFHGNAVVCLELCACQALWEEGTRQSPDDLRMDDPGLQPVGGPVPSFPRQVWAHVGASGTGRALGGATKVGKGLQEPNKEQLRAPGLSSWSRGG